MSREEFESVDLEKMPLEDVKPALAALCDHLGLKMEAKACFYGGKDYRAVPKEPRQPQQVLPTVGTEVLTKASVAPGSTPLGGLFVSRPLLAGRRGNVRGWYRGWVPGHGGDAWFIEHRDGTQAVYLYNEVEIVKEDE